jgi:hypothetical protein
LAGAKAQIFSRDIGTAEAVPFHEAQRRGHRRTMPPGLNSEKAIVTAAWA